MAIVIGGTSAEFNLKTVKLASTKYLDGLPTTGSESGHAFRDLEWEEKILEMTQKMGIGAQFGGKYYCHDVRVIRLPRHGASCPIGLGVSCSADRQAFAKINKNGMFLERLETDPGKYIPDTLETDVSEEVVLCSEPPGIKLFAICKNLNKYEIFKYFLIKFPQTLFIGLFEIQKQSIILLFLFFLFKTIFSAESARK